MYLALLTILGAYHDHNPCQLSSLQKNEEAISSSCLKLSTTMHLLHIKHVIVLFFISSWFYQWTIFTSSCRRVKQREFKCYIHELAIVALLLSNGIWSQSNRHIEHVKNPMYRTTTRCTAWHNILIFIMYCTWNWYRNESFQK